jgi:hypothetical protein
MSSCMPFELVVNVWPLICTSFSMHAETHALLSTGSLLGIIQSIWDTQLTKPLSSNKFVF